MIKYITLRQKQIGNMQLFLITSVVTSRELRKSKGKFDWTKCKSQKFIWSQCIVQS